MENSEDLPQLYRLEENQEDEMQELTPLVPASEVISTDESHQIDEPTTLVTLQSANEIDPEVEHHQIENLEQISCDEMQVATTHEAIDVATGATTTVTVLGPAVLDETEELPPSEADFIELTPLSAVMPTLQQSSVENDDEEQNGDQENGHEQNEDESIAMNTSNGNGSHHEDQSTCDDESQPNRVNSSVEASKDVSGDQEEDLDLLADPGTRMVICRVATKPIGPRVTSNKLPMNRTPVIREANRAPTKLDINLLIDAINELKNNKSRVTKISLEKCVQRRNPKIPKNEVSDFLNKLISDDILEKVKYRDYYGIRLKSSFKNVQISPGGTVDKSQTARPLVPASSSQSGSQLTADGEDYEMDGMSECSFSQNSVNDDIIDDDFDSPQSKNRNLVKRCSPTIMFFLRTCTSGGLSPIDLLKNLQAKRLLTLYDLEKFTSFMKTFFVDKGVCDQLENGNYKLNIGTDDESSNLTPSKSQYSIAYSQDSHQEDDDFDSTADESQKNLYYKKPPSSGVASKEELIEQVNRSSKSLTVRKVNETLDQIEKTTKNYSIANILSKIDAPGATESELATFLVKCCKLRLLKKDSPMYSHVIMYSIKKKSPSQASNELSELEYKKVVVCLKYLLRTIPLSPDFMLSGLKNKFKLLTRFDQPMFNILLRDRLMNEGFLQPLPSNRYRLNRETSNHNNIESELLKLGLIDTSIYCSAKRKMKVKDELALRPISQRKKIKKSLGPDFISLDQSMPRSSYDGKCEICLKSSDKNMVDCKRCKFKAHRLCLSDIDQTFQNNSKRYECESCRLKCCFCKKEAEKQFYNLIHCKKCNLAYHIRCLVQKPMLDNMLANCMTCEKTFIKYSNQKSANGGQFGSLEIDLVEASSSNAINVNLKPDEQVPTLEELKVIEKTEEVSCDVVQIRLDKSRPVEILKPRTPVLKTVVVRSFENKTGSVQPKKTIIVTATPNNKSTSSEIQPASKKTSESVDASGEESNQSNTVSPPTSNNENMKSTDDAKDNDETRIESSYSNGKNPTDWTVEDVVTFVKDIGFPEESLIFKKEAIDGKSLLLLRRNDVLTGLSLHLGPALKIYSYIYKLQASE